MNLPRATTNFYVQEYRDITLNTKLGKTSPRCNGSSNNVNLQRSRYARLKSDTDKLKYEKWSKYRFKPPKCRVWGNPKKPEKGQE